MATFPDYRKDNPYQQLLAEALQRQGVEVSFPSGYRRGLHFLRTLRSLGHPGPAAIHLHWPDPYLRGESWLARLLYAHKARLDLSLALGKRRALFWTLHNLNRHEQGGDAIEQSFYRWLGQRSATVFVHEKGLIEETTRQLGLSAEKIEVIPHGHYADHYGPATPKADARKLLGLEEKARVVLFLGMLRPYKGVHQLLDIWPEVVQAVPEAFLVIAGGGDQADYMASLRSMVTASPRVRLEPRFLEDEEIPHYHGAADLAVFPFERITTSGSLILALSYGRPVVAPNVPSIARDLSFQADLLYEPGDQKGLVRSLVKGLHANAAAWGPSFESIRNHYSWERAAEISARSYRQRIYPKGGSGSTHPLPGGRKR